MIQLVKLNRVQLSKLSRSVSPARFLSRYSKNEQIFIHKLDNDKYKYSLSSNPQSLAIGYGASEDPSPQEFQLEPQFLPLLHKLIHEEIHNDFSFIMEAGMNIGSYMPIYDFREIPDYARIPDVDSTFGYVRVDNQGKIIPFSYESNEPYRLIDGIYGMVKLSDFLYDKMKVECDKQQ